MAGATAINTVGNTIQFGIVANAVFTNNTNTSIVASPTANTLNITANDGLTLTSGAAVYVAGHLLQAGYYAVLGGYNLSGSVPAAMGAGTAGLGVVWNMSQGSGETDFINLQQGGVGGFRFYKNNNSTTPTLLALIDNTGKISASSVTNAIWNDIADYFEVEEDTLIEYGRAYVYADGHHRLSHTYAEMGVLGIASDTLGFGVGQKPDGTPQIPIALGGIVLACVDAVYPSGTPLTCTEDGALTKMDTIAKMEYPERILATFYKTEPKDTWNGIQVKGRHWVKVY